MVWPAIIGAIGTIAGGALSYAGQQDANQANASINAKTRRFNKSQAKKSRKFNRREVVKQRDWSEHMSSTAYQRSMSDMEAAGLNPMLAYQQGGASAGSAQAASTAAANAGTQHRMENELNQGLGLAEIATQVNTAKLLQAQTKRQDAETEYINTQAQRTSVQTEGDIIRNTKEGATQPIWEKGGEVLEKLAEKYGPVIDALIAEKFNISETNSAKDAKEKWTPGPARKPKGPIRIINPKGDGKTDFQRQKESFNKQLLEDALKKYKHRRAWEKRKKKNYGN